MRLVFVGDGSLRPRVDAILADAGVRDLAWFAGERRDVVPLLQGLDCFVLPSLAEGVSNTILEAMACGLPVAAYPVTGPRDVIGDSKAGMLHEDLRVACLGALKLDRADALARAGLFTWRAATEQFLGHLHPRKRASAVPAYA